MFIIQSKEKQRNGIGILINIKVILFDLQLKKQMHHMIFLIFNSFIPVSQKLEVFSSIFCGTKIILQWITPLPLPSFLDLPSIMPYLPINM